MGRDSERNIYQSMLSGISHITLTLSVAPGSDNQRSSEPSEPDDWSIALEGGEEAISS